VIHILNTIVLDVNKFVKDKISDYANEEEILVLGGGNFYKNKECTQLGYNYLGIENNKQYFECYYKISEKSSRNSNKTVKKTKYNLSEIIKKIKDDESSQFIDNVDDLDLIFSHLLNNVTPSDKKKILRNIVNPN
jgi:gas vesicle protein